MARWENILSDSSRLLLENAESYVSRIRPAVPGKADDEFLPTIDDEGRDTRTAVHSRWHFPRALRWWNRRGEPIQLAG